MSSFFKENIVSIITIAIVIIGILVISSMLGINFDTYKKSSLDKIVTIETFENNSLCNVHKSNPIELNKKCQELTNDNCKVTGCCILLNGKKCVAGNLNGPIFLTDSSGNNINIDYFYYKNKCINKNNNKKN